MNHCLRANQTQLQTQLAEEERKGKENGESEGKRNQRQKSLSASIHLYIITDLTYRDSQALKLDNLVSSFPTL